MGRVSLYGCVPEKSLPILGSEGKDTIRSAVWTETHGGPKIREENWTLKPRSAYGDPTKGYRLYDSRVIHSRNVTFDKNKKPESSSDSSLPMHMDSDDDSNKLIIDSGNNEDQEHGEFEAPQPPREPEPVRRLSRERRQRNYYGSEQTNLAMSQEPTSFKEAVSSLINPKCHENGNEVPQ